MELPKTLGSHLNALAKTTIPMRCNMWVMSHAFYFKTWISGLLCQQPTITKMLPNATATPEPALVNEFVTGNSFLQKIVATAAYCLILLFSITGNSCIILTVYRDKRLRNNTNILMTNMAVSDLVFSLIAIPRSLLKMNLNGWLIKGDLGLVLCKIIPFLQKISIAVSFYSCIFIAIDRYYAHPFKGGFSRSRLKYIIPGIWSVGGVLLGPQLYSFRLSNRGGLTICKTDWSQAGISNSLASLVHQFVLLALFMGIPISIIATIYLLIVKKMRKLKAAGRYIGLSKLREKQNKKLLKMSYAIVGILFLGWSPYTILTVLNELGKLPNFRSLKIILYVAIFIAQSNCIYNFFICLIFMQAYRRNFKRILSTCFSIVKCSKRNPFRARAKKIENFGPGIPNFACETNEEIKLKALRSKSDE